MPPTAKAVLMAMADYADDQGVCWPSIAGLCEYTCFGKSAVIEAIKHLEKIGVVIANRADRYRTTYSIRPEDFSGSGVARKADMSGSRTSPSNGGLVRLAEDEVRQPEDEVRETDTNHHKPSRTTSKATTKGACALVLPDWIEPAVWADWVEYRRKGKNPLTDKATELSIRELDKLRSQGFDARHVIENAILSGWRGLYAPRGGPQKTSTVVPIRPSASADFRGKSYAGTAIEDLPPDLRDAARAAIADG
ncbi:helix-turn-helix domain-containing protein [Stenotrophomonas sp. 59]|uniref:helix-turn-helix domain-containing protein n=1 Tax=Stenotrophomonas sp. 59 TaxID=3051120 RepID=UPI00256EF3DB|nr:helix-turn-helix domain-containing protein [Stenotrophomonas sp. 59]